MIPEVFAGDLVLADAPLASEIGCHDRQQPGLGHEPQTDRRPAGSQQLAEFGEDPLARQMLGKVSVATDGGQSRGLDFEVERCGQPHGSDHPEGVLAEPAIGLTDRSKKPERKVIPTAVRVDKGGLSAGSGTPGHRVHGEIASGQVFLDRLAELDGVRMAEVRVRNVAPEGGDFVLATGLTHDHGAEPILVEGVREELLDALGRGVGGQVPVGRLAAQ